MFNSVRDFTVTSNSMICSLSTGGCISVRDFTVTSSSICSLSTGWYNKKC